MDLRNQQIKETYGNLATINTVAGTPTTGVLQNGAGSNVTTLTIAGTLDATNVDATNLTGTLTGNVVATNLTGTLQTAAQTNITSVGTLTGLTVSGDANFDSGTLFVDVSENKVGIGTTSPDEILTLPNDGTIALTTAGQSYIGSDTSDRSLNLMQYLKQDLSGGFLSTTALSRGRSYIKIDDGNVRFGTSGTQSVAIGSAITVSERMRIDSSGNVGIGVTPSFQLDVRSTSVPAIRISRSGTAGSNAATGITFEAREPTVGTGQTSAIYGILGNLVFRTGGTSGDSTGGSEIARFTSDGLTFNGDTAAANALDDYEQGTFTPTVVGSTSAGTASYAAQVGRFTKIGNKVTYEAQLTYSGHTGTGNMRVTLPTTVVNSTNYYASASIGYCNNISLTAGNVITCFATSNLNYVSFYQYPTGGGASTAVPVDAAGAIFFSITYESQ